MFDSRVLYKQRLSAHIKETSRYLRYIFNGHTAFALLFLIAASAYYYQQWLTQLPDDFPTQWVLSIVFGLIVSYSPVRTLLKEPDLVFIIPAEHKMGPYFRNSMIYSYVIQLYIIFLASAALGPLYFASYPDREGNTYLTIVAVILLYKLWNLLANWWMLKVRDRRLRHTDLLARVLLNIAVFYFLILGEMLLAGITALLFVIVLVNDYLLGKKQAGIQWELLVEKDRSRMQSFYRFANLATDVPHLQTPIKQRHWLVSMLTKGVSFEYKQTFDYLYRITFIRSGDYLNMYIRLIIIGGIFIYFIPNLWMKLAFALLFLYLSSFQMITLYNHHRTVMWMDIYPVTKEMRQKAMTSLLFQLIIIQTILFSLVFLVSQEYFGVALVLIGGFLFNFAFIQGYVKRKLA